MERKGKYMPIWGRYVESFDQLSSNQLGKLLSAMMHYYFDGEEPKLPGTLSAYWSFVRQDLDFARQSYEKKMEASRKGGKRSAQLRKEMKEANASELKSTEGTSTPVQDPQPITITESKTESKTESITESISKTEIDKGSAPADAGISASERTYGEFSWVKLTDQQYRSLQEKMGDKTLRDCIRYIDRAAQSNGNRNRWKDWYLVLLRCYENGWYNENSPYGKPSIPKGASGELGEAELEAIRMVLAQ